MSSTGVPLATQLPPSLRPVAHYLKTGSEYETRDPVIAYWCRLAALQAGLKLDKKSPEAIKVLMPLMDWLEKEKKVLANNEAVTSEVVACAHIDNFALKLFMWADREDRAGHFNKNVVKAFYTAGNLYEVLNVLGELTPENAHHRDYAKWKAAYIHNCLKNGETPVAGPVEGAPEGPDSEDQNETNEGTEDQAVGGWNDPGPSNWNQPVPAPRKPAQPVYPQESQPDVQPTEDSTPAAAPPKTGSLSTEMTAKAQKYCKYASSSLDYDDTTTAIDYLHKALKIIQTGKE